MKTELFQSCGHCWVFQICWHIECSTFTASSFRIWNSATGIPSPSLVLFVLYGNQAHASIGCPQNLTSLQNEQQSVSLANYYVLLGFYVMVYFFIVLSTNKEVRQLISCLKITGWSWKIASHRNFNSIISSVQFSCSVVSDSLLPHGLQHARLPCPSSAPRAYSNSCP